MSLHYHYKLQTVNHPVTALGGRWVRPRPVIWVTIIGPANARLQEALLDPGSDDTVFPSSFAPFLGVDLGSAPVGEAAGVGGQTVPVLYARVKLRITDGNEQREWPAWVGFTSARLHRPLLGFAGCLQFFTATFHGDLEQVELTVNRLYPGT